ncbi:MAG: hypothetical protein ACLFN5_02915 [bacterium]
MSSFFCLKTENSIITLPVEIIRCDTFFRRLAGALPEGGIAPDRAYLLPACRWVHTFFMRRPIAVLFYDEPGFVIEYYPSVKPNRILPRQPRAAGAVELAPFRLGAKLNISG